MSRQIYLALECWPRAFGFFTFGNFSTFLIIIRIRIHRLQLENVDFIAEIILDITSNYLRIANFSVINTVISPAREKMLVAYYTSLRNHYSTT